MYNNLRITGLASPFDTEEMVGKLMETEKVKLNRVEQDKQLLVWKREAYNDLNKDFANFILNTRKEFGLTTTTSTGAMVSNSYEKLTWVKSATSSNESVGTVSTTAKAMSGSYNVEVEQLAEGVKMASSSNITVEGGTKDNLASQFGLNEGDVIKFSIDTKNGTKEFEFTGSQSINDVVKAINNAKVEVGEGDNKKEVSLGVRAVYDANIDRFFLQTEGTGTDTWIKIDDKSVIDGKNGFIEGDNSLLKLNTNQKSDSEGKYRGKNARINFDGAEGIEIGSNQFTINGMDFNIKSKGSFTTTVDTDIDAFYEKIEKFVEEYNKLVEKSNLLLTQKKNRSYQPLTADQKKEMDKKDIELWEEKAKSGLLRNDELVSRTMRNSRTWMYEKIEGVEGSFKHLTEIGISTEKFSQGSLGGKLSIDEIKLKEAIRKDADGVLELLFKSPDYGKGELEGVTSYKSDRELSSEQLQAKRKQSGIVTRLYDNLILGMQDIINKSGIGDDSNLYRNVKSNMLIDFVTKHSSISMIDKDVMKLESKIDDLNVYLFEKENHYYSKFAAMEKALSRMNQQSMWLMQQFSN
ncbi:flagellar filament capping protein FliD [Anaerosalibacter bizertensis]|uniref:Flagellar hook-associated protein 2 n=1 Tax=Anaerosalibacter bizertensis TaxID=932217 RepID=A0A9Q4FKK6_9FIRM|nr:flagellar filament capping protein FliD [Anaerosalibacter bizertensis]MCG4564681.1 flagellar filament capping protein FliD [Anaerosalibacter bizertensis]MCG4582244.1 flagellar filament capping protein FliD [Anaerosalibacter bizertensis]